MSDTQGLGPKQFLQRFFGDGNELDLDGPPKIVEALRTWVQRVEDGRDRILLPRKENGTVTWYALADSGRSARAFREELLAAVGPSYTDFLGVGANLHRSDPVEAAILDFTGRHAFKLSIVDPTFTEACRRALVRMLKLHDERPPSQARPPRTPGLILRDFEFALQQGDREAASEAMLEIRASGHLTGQNLRFLEIRRSEAFNEWDAIWQEVAEGTVVELRRPVRITQALLKAIYRVHLLQYEQGVRVADALACFDGHLRGSVASLLNTREGMTAPEVAKLFMLKAAAARDPRLRDSLLEGSSVRGADKIYLKALADLVEDPRSENDSATIRDEAVAAYMADDIDRAFDLLVEGRGGQWRMKLLLRCALDLGTFRAAELALGAIENSSATERDTLRNDSALARHLQELEERYTAPSVGVPGGWLDWANMVSDGDLDDNRAAELAQRGAEEWSLDALIARPGDVVTLADAMLGFEEPGKQQLRLALPYLQAFLLSRPEPAPELKPILYSLLSLYALDDESRSVGTWRAATEVLKELIRCGVSDEEYTDAVDSLQILLDDGLPLARVDDTLDLLEALVVLAPGRPMTTRAALLVHGGLTRWLERLGRPHVELFNQLGREAGATVSLPMPLKEDGGTGPSGLDRLRGQVVALYSLNEGALARVKTMLEGSVSGVRVLTFNDKVGGRPVLREAARTADVFVIVTGAAKHAATEFIEANRGADLLTLRTHGKGSSSMIRVLENAAPD